MVAPSSQTQRDDGAFPQGNDLMSNISKQIDQMLNSIEENWTPKHIEAISIPLMLDCMSLIERRLPPVAVDSLRIAELYAKEQTGLDQVFEAVERCWQALGSGEASMRLSNPNVSCIRAVLCVLLTQARPDASEFLDVTRLFLELLDNVRALP